MELNNIYEKKKRKSYKCKVCKCEFVKHSTIQVWCSPECGIILTKNKRKAQEAKERREQYRATKERKEALQTRSELMKKAQKAVNRYIRERDKGLPCISCQRLDAIIFDAGHYRSAGAHPELRFNEENIHAQCRWCNSYLSGNLTLYRQNLIHKIGLDRVEWLEGAHPPANWSKDEIREIERIYKAKLKELIRLNNTT